jgi:hypothetical protein
LQIDFDLKYLTFKIAFRNAPKLQTLESHMWFFGTLRRAGEKKGVISIRKPDLGEVDNETKVNSGYEPPPISVDEDVAH